jgi:hypothetical protein
MIQRSGLVGSGVVVVRVATSGVGDAAAVTWALGHDRRDVHRAQLGTTDEYRWYGMALFPIADSAFTPRHSSSVRRLDVRLC